MTSRLSQFNLIYIKLDCSSTLGNQGIIALAVIGIAAVGAYVLNIGGIKDIIRNLVNNPAILPGYSGGTTPVKGIAVGEFNPSIPKDTRPTKNGKPCGYGGFPPC